MKSEQRDKGVNYLDMSRTMSDVVHHLVILITFSSLDYNTSDKCYLKTFSQISEMTGRQHEQKICNCIFLNPRFMASYRKLVPF